MRKIIVINKIVVVALTILFTACGGGSKKDNSKESEEFDVAKEELKQKIKTVTYSIPDPTEVPYLIEATGAEYNAVFLNSNKNVDKYLTTFSTAAINMGVYASDLAYLTSYEKTQESIDNLQAIKKLADYLGVGDAIDEVILKRFEENNSKDSLRLLINKSVDNVDKYLKEGERNKIASLVTASSFIEGLHLSTELVNTYPHDLVSEEQRNLILTPILKIILDQKKAIKEVVKLLEAVEPDAEVEQFISDLKLLFDAYKTVNIEEKIKNNQADLILSEKILAPISKQIKETRARLIAY